MVQHGKEPFPQALASLNVLLPFLKAKDGFLEAEITHVRRRAGQEEKVQETVPAACEAHALSL